MATTPNIKPLLTFETEKTSTQVTLRCSGRLVSDTSGAFQSTAKEIIPATKLLVLDFSGVEYLDSSGLGAVVAVFASAKRSGCQLKIVNLTPRVKELFSMTRLFDVLASHSDPDAAQYRAF